MDKTYFGSDIPKFTKGDEERFVRAHWDDQITADVRFSDLYKAKQDVIHTPLREFVYRKWHLDRMIVLGDASHKVRNECFCEAVRHGVTETVYR
jgi:2-polyprenyl-6-methoxyphenol hydroxylase-like FAD-dependent oxidoreductase